MFDLDLFRDFRSKVAAPSADAQGQAAARLARAIEGEQTPGRSILRLIRKRRYAALAFATLAAATGTALFISTPWHNSPGFLEKAHAALTPPAEAILHMKWLGSGLTDLACNSPSEVWIDQTPPHRFRALLTYPEGYFRPDSGECPFEGVKPSEVGGDSESGQQFPTDPVRELREAIRAGRAHHEGQTQLEGRTVERIRIDPAPTCPKAVSEAVEDYGSECFPEPGYAYVDPKTLHPVRIEGFQEIARPGGDFFVFRVERFVTFEYLPRTAANIALTDIQARHPRARP